MTPAQKDRLTGFNASLKTRGVSVVIKPDERTITALVESVDDNSRKRLQISDDLISEVVHVRRDMLAANAGEELAEVKPEDIAEITRDDSDKTYRVKHFKDDPQRPAILFFCTLA